MATPAATATNNATTPTAAITPRSSQNGASVGIRPGTPTPAAGTARRPARGRPVQSARRPASGGPARPPPAHDATATAGSSHPTSGGPVSGGSDRYCHHPIPNAAAATVSSGHTRRRRIANARITSGAPDGGPGDQRRPRGRPQPRRRHGDLDRGAVDHERHGTGVDLITGQRGGRRVGRHPVRPVVVPRRTGRRRPPAASPAAAWRRLRPAPRRRAVGVLVGRRRAAVLLDDAVGSEAEVRLVEVAEDDDFDARVDGQLEERVAADDRRPDRLGRRGDPDDARLVVGGVGGVGANDAGRGEHGERAEHGGGEAATHARDVTSGRSDRRGTSEGFRPRRGARNPRARGKPRVRGAARCRRRGRRRSCRTAT